MGPILRSTRVCQYQRPDVSLGNTRGTAWEWGTASSWMVAMTWRVFRTSSPAPRRALRGEARDGSPRDRSRKVVSWASGAGVLREEFQRRSGEGESLMARIYLASSWRNTDQPAAVEVLRRSGHSVYDFRNPDQSHGFSWSDVGLDLPCTAQEYLAALQHPRAAQGFMNDFRAMRWADTCVLLLPCGRSAHLELGWMSGAGKRTIICTRDGEEPELMALLADHVCASFDDVVAVLGHGQ